MRGARVLILAPVGRDAQSAATLVERHGLKYVICADLAALAAAVNDTAGAVLVTEEALIRADPTPLIAALDAQPAWSDLPFILLSVQRSGPSLRGDPVRGRLPERVTNVMVLERPLGTVSLLSAVDWALAARKRQFQIRDHLAELERRAEELRQTAIQLSDSEGALRESQGYLRDLLNSSGEAFYAVDKEGRTTVCNAAFMRMMKFDSRDQVIGVRIHDLIHHSHPDGSPYLSHECPIYHAAKFGVAAHVEDEVFFCPDGTSFPVDYRAHPVVREGELQGAICTFVDVTERKRGELALREAAETLEQKVVERTTELHAEMADRMRAEEQLRQAQKMEAVGQLTGGIAHDFNNMLTGIIGSLDIVKRRMASGRTADLERFMDAASTSAQRAAALTHRLLAFSRRQSLDSKPIDVNDLVQGLEELLVRTIGEQIVLDVVLAPDLALATADANQLESALLNLAINARDAMPDGGRLMIDTDVAHLDEAYTSRQEGLAPGDYVVVAVSDTGVGMSNDVLEKAIDPFFTTKPLGQGTGLGLSMVYGFAKQSGGHIRLHSQPGQGTSVKIYLPVAKTQALETPAPAVGEAPRGDGETVLVVEDDASVRLLVLEVLAELGYAVEEAVDAKTAIPIIESDRRIDLIVSDVGLPGMNGRQLAEIARQHRPELPILFITGYAENAAVRSGFLAPGMQMIAKPFALDVLAVKIRAMTRRIDA